MSESTSKPRGHYELGSKSGSPLRAIFSDLDGTLVHFPKVCVHGVWGSLFHDAAPVRKRVQALTACLLVTRPSAWQWFEEHGSRIISRDPDAKRCVMESASGEQRECWLLPSSTMGDGLVSDRSVELVQQLRDEGVLFVIVTAARKSTLMERLPLLPACDVAVCETGSRMYLSDGSLDSEWASRFEHICGPLERELDVQQRPEPLWCFFRRLQQIDGLKCDSRSYYGCFRVVRAFPCLRRLRPTASEVSGAEQFDRLALAQDTRDDPSVDKALRACIERELPDGVDWAMNLGKAGGGQI